MQREFATRCPSGWVARGEVPVLSRELAQLFGYAPHADVLLEREDGSRRLWIEFEVSRADPVANHAKFATVHLFQPQLSTDSFVAMVSPHVARGRRNLAANTIGLMRHVGMSAFQTVLFPRLAAGEIQRLNHVRASSGDTSDMPGTPFPEVGPEIERAFAVAEPVTSSDEHRIHLAGDVLDALLNVRRWNEEIAGADRRAVWGRRTVTYFVFDPHSGAFAPAKFCAYLPIPVWRGQVQRQMRVQAEAQARPAALPAIRDAMSVALYATLDGADTRFDGHRAQTHLTHALGMRAVPVRLEGDGPIDPIGARFRGWLERHRDVVSLNGRGTVALVPPVWFK